MLLEFVRRWPFIRRHEYIAAPVASATPSHAHRSWVRTEHGIGWIHHHEPSGYVVEFPDGRILACRQIENVTAAEALQ